MTAYQKYQLQWMIDHDHSLDELIDELDRCQADWAENNEAVSEIFQAWEQNIGFGSEIWACEEEAAESGELEPKVNSKLEVPLGDGHFLVAEISPGSEYKEVYLGVTEDPNIWWQDLAVVREAYDYKDSSVVHKHGEYEVLVYGDADDEDYTDKFKIPIYKSSAI